VKTLPIALAVPPQPTDHRQGPVHARITMIEYGDFESAACRAAAPTTLQCLERYPGRLQFIYRHFPAEESHPHAVLAAEAAEAAAAQDKFWEMHDALFRHQARLGPKDLHRYAVEIGLDPVRYAAEMDDHIYLQRSTSTAHAAATSARRPRSSSAASTRTSRRAWTDCSRRLPRPCGATAESGHPAPATVRRAVRRQRAISASADNRRSTSSRLL